MPCSIRLVRNFVHFNQSEDAKEEGEVLLIDIEFAKVRRTMEMSNG
ncbi:hypothetical protein THF5H11_30652 [Vibrio jasicida]|uniref:Uncharacterized protein n=1 Tax=Vibrio jasicida TaxID=766224 RepID=A0AAU9QKV4_9VIBR|nr:hypothetical protein THF5H11_30652 [Vibrio jasicida]CAH1573967.1 hypothetical protein THF1C08_20016 [Vibrio jasicida]CAH1583871.1 hypothetical protein THF1A12_20016 [Vibrio jasicida]